MNKELLQERINEYNESIENILHTECIVQIIKELKREIPTKKYNFYIEELHVIVDKILKMYIYLIGIIDGYNISANTPITIKRERLLRDSLQIFLHTNDKYFYGLDYYGAGTKVFIDDLFCKFSII